MSAVLQTAIPSINEKLTMQASEKSASLPK